MRIREFHRDRLAGIRWLAVASAIVALGSWVAGTPALADDKHEEDEVEEVEVTFPDGVAVGDVTSTSAVLWTRAAFTDEVEKLKVEVFTNPELKGKKAFKQKVRPSAEDDFTAKALASKLKPDTTYYFRWRHGHDNSDVGTFRTAPDPSAAADVRFVYTGDTDSLQQLFDANTMAVLNQALSEDPDFWAYIGDVIYSDSSLRPAAGLTPAATTLNEYRDTYRANRAVSALRNILGSVATYVTWDDHEVLNDYSGQTVDPARYANGREAFLEYMPTLEVNLPEDPTCAGDPIFRTFSWGSEVDVFILDERSCRSRDAQFECATSPATVDLVPTLPDLPPPFNFRTQFRAQLLGAGVPAAQVDLLIPAAASPACLAALGDPSRTVLGPVQKQALKDALAASTASFKFIVNEYPIQEMLALPYDRWEGYGAERAEILSFIRDFVSGHTIFITADTHADLVNDVAINRFLNPAPIATEVVTGPVSTFTFAENLGGFAAGLGLPAPFVVGAFHQILSIAGTQCRNLDIDSYALVEVDAVAGTATISVKDENGNPVPNANPFDPLNTSPCTRTVGP